MLFKSVHQLNYIVSWCFTRLGEAGCILNPHNEVLIHNPGLKTIEELNKRTTEQEIRNWPSSVSFAEDAEENS